MTKIKKLRALVAFAFIAIIVLAIIGCKEQNNTALINKYIDSNKKIVATAPTTDPRIIIPGFQQIFEPAGVPLTDKQQKLITEALKPLSPNDNDMRGIFGVFNKEQKKALVNDCREKLSKSNCPLTKKQESRIMKLKPGSKDQSLADIYTLEQIQFLIQSIGN